MSSLQYVETKNLTFLLKLPIYINEPRHVISNNVVFWQVLTQTSLCSLLLNLETPNDGQSVA